MNSTTNSVVEFTQYLKSLPKDVLVKMCDVLQAYDLLQSYNGSFTMKSKIYLDKLKKMLPAPESLTNGHLGCLSNLAHAPLLPTSAYDDQIIHTLRGLPSSELTLKSGTYAMHLLEKLLTSMVNKAMLMIVLEYSASTIRVEAREVLVDHLLNLVWPDGTNKHNLFRPVFRSFTDIRIRNFRDSLSRHYRDCLSRSRMISAESPDDDPNATPPTNGTATPSAQPESPTAPSSHPLMSSHSSPTSSPSSNLSAPSSSNSDSNESAFIDLEATPHPPPSLSMPIHTTHPSLPQSSLPQSPLPHSFPQSLPPHLPPNLPLVFRSRHRDVGNRVLPYQPSIVVGKEPSSSSSSSSSLPSFFPPQQQQQRHSTDVISSS